MASSLTRSLQKVVPAMRATAVSAPARNINTFLTKGDNVVVNKLTNQGPVETVATIFGSTSLVGPFVCERLARQGMTLALPYRDDYTRVRHNKLVGEVGQVALLPTDLFDKESVDKSVLNSNLVVNIIGSMEKTIHYSLHDANVKTAYRIAKVAKENGVSRFIHFSALGADPAAASDFLRAKYDSELAVKEFFPNASIIRPAPMYAFDSRLVCEIGRAAVSRFYISFGSDSKIQPVAAEDVSLAVAQIAANPEVDGQTWELAGDTVLTRGELAELVRLTCDYRHANFFNVPGQFSVSLAKLAELAMIPKWFCPHALRIGRAEYDAENIVVTPKYGVKNLQDLGITPRNFKLGVLKSLKPYLSPNAVAQSAVDGVPLSKWRMHGHEATH